MLLKTVSVFTGPLQNVINIRYLAENPKDGFLWASISACKCPNLLIVEINNIEKHKYEINLIAINDEP